MEAALFKIVVGAFAIVIGMAAFVIVLYLAADLGGAVATLIGLPVACTLLICGLIGGMQYGISGICEIPVKHSYDELYDQKEVVQQMLRDIEEQYKAEGEIENLRDVITSVHSYNELASEMYDKYEKYCEILLPEPQWITDWRGFGSMQELKENLKLEASEWLVESNDDMLTMLQMELMSAE